MSAAETLHPFGSETQIGSRGENKSSLADRPVAKSGNVGEQERLVSIVAGAVVGAIGLYKQGLSGLIGAAAGGAMVYRGVTGQCPLYSALGVDTKARGDLAGNEADLSHGIEVSTALLINKPASDLYSRWRDFASLPTIMSHLQSVKVEDERRSHWIAKAPAIAGGKVEWDAEVTSDVPDSMIAWRSLPGSEIDAVGEIQFAKAPGERGTEVRVKLKYLPPAGRVGHWIAGLFGESPAQTMREDLRRFKQMMEVGEIPTTEGQPAGSCA